MVETTTEQPSLGVRLGPLFESGFFRPLSRPTAAIYVDCAERLMRSADEGGQIVFNEARLLVQEAIAAHPDTQLDEDEGGRVFDPKQQASRFFNKLLEAEWIQSRQVSLDEHWVWISPKLRMLIGLLHDLAETRRAELKNFAGTLRSICKQLLAPGALDPKKLSPEEMRQTVSQLLDQATRAEEQIHAVESLIIEHENAQRSSATAQETLDRFLVEFDAGEHMVCYDAMQEAGLLPRLNQARAIVEEARSHSFAKDRLAGGLAEHYGIDRDAAFAEAERMFGALERKLGAMPKKQHLIDGRISEFARLSAARYRYQTELRAGRAPEQVKEYIDSAGHLHGGSSFGALRNEAGMTLCCPQVQIYFGVDSLARPRKKRPPVELRVDASGNGGGSEKAREAIREMNRNLLTPRRGAAFVARILPKKGSSVSSHEIEISSVEETLDLFSALSFESGKLPESRSPVQWKVVSDRGEFCMEPDDLPWDRLAERRFERFTICRSR